MIGGDGIAGCEFASLQPGDAAFARDDLRELRRLVATSQLPDSPCQGCRHRLQHDLPAPPLRDYGSLPVRSEADAPRQVVVLLGPDGLPPAALDLLRREWAQLAMLTIDAGPGDGRALAAALAALPDAQPAPRRRVRTHDASALAALHGHGPIDAIELTIGAFVPATLAEAKTVATALGAKLTARFVFTPADWFWFEDVARGCAELEVPLEVHVLDRGGIEPLATLAPDDLLVVKDHVAGSWERFKASRATHSVSEPAFGRLCAELRHLLQQRLTDELRAAAAPPTARLALPHPQHQAFDDPTRRDHWRHAMFDHGHMPLVDAWLVEHVQGPTGTAVLRLAWFRALVQRRAHERRIPALLEALRRTYATAKARKALAAEDREFAAAFDIGRHGGPWAERLGLTHERNRKRPFAIGKARPAPTDAQADVTVLIPSYRHAAYVQETIRSVLAQRYPNFKLLVVDDRSPDDTVARAREISDPRLEVRVNATNLGLGNSVLEALASIDTPYFALLNSDDLFHPDRLQRCRDVLAVDPTVQLVTTNLVLVDQDGGELQPDNTSLVLDGIQVFDWVHWYARTTPSATLPPDRVFPELLARNFLATSTNLFGRTDWLRAQADSLRSLKYCLDWRLFLEAARTGALRHLSEPLAAYRLHATNTVWFREGRRWSYYLEVNRVAADAIRRFAADATTEDAQLSLLEGVAAHLAQNRETDGIALFLNAVLDTLALDRLATTSPRAEAVLQQLNAAAEDVRRRLDYAIDARDEATRQLRVQARLGALAGEQRRVERDARRWLQGYCTTLENRLAEGQLTTDRLEKEKRALLQRQAELDQMIRGHVDQTRKLDGDLHGANQRDQASRQRAEHAEQRASALQRDLDGLRADLATARGAASAVEELRGLLQQELAAARTERDAIRTECDAVRKAGDEQARLLRADLARVSAQRDELHAERDEVARARDQATADGADLRTQLANEREAHAKAEAGRSALEQALTDERTAARAAAEQAAHATARLQQQLQAESKAKDTTQAELRQATRQRDDLQRALDAETARLRALQQVKADLEKRRNELTGTLARCREEMARLAASREYRAGNFLWNKMPLAYMSRRGKKWYRRLVDAKNRFAMLFRRKASAEGTAVVTACWQWPIYSHTFVYQEMIGLTHMGLDVRLFHWDLGETAQLHKAFGYLADNRTQLQPIWENHKRDKEHFDKTKPGRLRAFLELVAKATGRKVDELEKEPIVLQGCTFARMAELAGASYLHSYFFYDQSFMAMQAAWLLELPRGVSCYADHMLADYPFKLVPMHVELADVVVATSARIKRELSQMTGGRFDDKIIVKPNGVDGARFPPVVRQDRKPGDPFEVVSISRIEPKKGLTHLVEAVAALKQKGYKVKAHIVGSKDQHSKGSLEYAAEFEQRIKDLGVEDEVILHGMKRQEELPPILQRCRAFVAPYVEMGSGDKDGIPTAMLEGLASGLPVVTTDSGSILEVVTTEVEGLVVSQRDSKAFAAALQRLIDDPALERRMAKAARARFDREFDIRVTEVRLHERVAGLVKMRKAAGESKPAR
ncbi:MAG: glycosyltransferase [Planctomycetes bacterium]|nr:glycosyltransferase [Planctomycetota bacterium]